MIQFCIEVPRHEGWCRRCEKEMAVLSMFRTFIRGAPDLLAAKAHSHKTGQ